MSRSTKNNIYRSASKKKPTKIYLDSSKKVTTYKEEEKKNEEKNNINSISQTKKEEPPQLTEQEKKDKIIHENNLKVAEIIQNDIDKIEKENNLIIEEMNRLKEEEKDLLKRYEDLIGDIESERDELEEIKEINSRKNREFLSLSHHRLYQQNSNGNPSPSQANSGRSGEPNVMTLGDFFDFIQVMGMRRENTQRVSYELLESLPSESYPRNNNNNEKCNICGFEFCYQDTVTKLQKCHHIFHRNCLVNRLSSTNSSQCPSCNISII
mgnify:CR=1 FL=1